MAEAARPRPMEYYNPRPLILGICFCWGIVMGFCLYYFRPPEQPAPPARTGTETAEPVTATGVRPDRAADLPVITPVDDRTPTVAARPNLLTMELEPPPAILTTEGGLTGRVAAPPQQGAPRMPSVPPTRGAPMTAPPPIPELMP